MRRYMFDGSLGYATLSTARRRNAGGLPSLTAAARVIAVPSANGCNRLADGVEASVKLERSLGTWAAGSRPPLHVQPVGPSTGILRAPPSLGVATPWSRTRGSHEARHHIRRRAMGRRERPAPADTMLPKKPGGIGEALQQEITLVH